MESKSSTTSRFGTGFTGMILVCLPFLGQCTSGELPVEQYVRPSQHVSLPERCLHLYNTGHHTDWAECMGVK